MLVLAFDTATDVATSALVRDGDLVGERASVARTLLADVDALLRDAGLVPTDVDALAIGTGPGSFTGTRIGIAVGRGLGLALGVPAAGVSTLDALAAATPGALPLVDARRGEVFTPGPGGGPPVSLAPDALAVGKGTTCIGDGAVRYRAVLEARGASVPPDDDPGHAPRALFHARLATGFGSADEVQPVYVRAPDARPLD
jgi:tRNA threonylcarbamoyl adenosine modification protein YeaZ